MVFRRNNDGFSSFSIVRFLTTPFRVVGNTISELLGGDEASFNQSTSSRIFGILGLPFRLLLAFFGFAAQTWASSRSFSAFIRGLPVLAVGLTFFGLMLLEDLVNTEGKAISANRGYLERQKALFPDKPKDAEMFAQKLVEIKSDAPLHKYLLAVSKALSGETTAALDLMHSISPENSSGYADGHIWLARFYERNQTLNLDEKTRDDLVEKHLQFALDSNPDNQVTWWNLASMYDIRTKRHETGTPEWQVEADKAIDFYSKIASGETTLIQIYAIPRKAELELEFKPADDIYRRLDREIIRIYPLAQKFPNRVEIWTALVQCAVLQKDYSQAMEMVQKGFQLASDEDSKQKIRQLASEIYLKSAEEFKDLTDRRQYRERIDRLCEGIRMNPMDTRIGNRLLELITERDDAGAVLNELWLRDSIVGARVPGVIHALVGMLDISTGNVLDGEKHWKIANEQLPNAQLVINNLIYVATRDMPERFRHVLDMITLAIELYPQQSSLYQTRGRFLRSQGRYQEAIIDLQNAVEKLPEIVSSHKLLIDCYEQIGDADNALAQRQILERKLGEMDSRERKQVMESLERIE